MNKSILTGVSMLSLSMVTAQERPNVIFIMSDQHQKLATGCYGSVNTTISGESITPNIDKLAEAGVVYDNAYTPSPLSAPARASLTTGCYPHEHTALRHKYSGHGSGEARYPGILENLPCIAELFRGAGYKTASIGKMHVHGELKDVEDLGYDYVDLRFYTEYPGAHYADRANGDWNRRYREMSPYNKMTYSSIDGEKFSDVDSSVTVKSNHNNTKYIETIVEREEQMIDYLTATESVKYIKERSSKDEPFFIQVGFEKPHEPYTTHRRYMDKFDPAKVVLPDSWNEFYREGAYPFLMNWLLQYKPTEERARNTTAGYLACLNSMDEQVGRVVEACKEAGIYDNTVIIYTTDHGDHMYNHSLLQKHCMYETATNVPLIISYPKHYDKGVRSDALVSTIDILPTILDFAGIDTPDSFEGESLVDYKSLENKDRYVYAEFYEGGNYKMFPTEKSVPMKMCRFENYKYVYTHGFIEQLYDLSRDANEMDNLVLKGDEYKELIEKLRLATLADWTIDSFPLFDVKVKRNGEELSFAPQTEAPASEYILYRSSSNDFAQAVEVARGDKMAMHDTVSKGKAKLYYWIVSLPKLTRTFGATKMYKGVKVATDVLDANLPMSVTMEIEPRFKRGEFSYHKRANY